MLRLQSSWLLESVAEIYGVESLFFPFFHRFSAMSWLSRKGITLYLNNPLDSQAMLARAWLDVAGGIFTAKNLQKFNQVIKKPLELELNPFKTWKDRLFSSQQLDYLFYWREAAFEIEDDRQREIFWSAVYQIISYWMSNQKAGMQPTSRPDEMMAFYLHRHQAFIKGREGRIEFSSIALDELSGGSGALVVFPLIFDDDDSAEVDIQTVFHAWFHGHADLENARRDIKAALRKYLISFDRPRDFSLHTRLAEGSDVAVLTWSGNELPPGIFEQELVEPLRKAFSGQYARSRLTLKAVDKSRDSYDYLLIFHN